MKQKQFYIRFFWTTTECYDDIPNIIRDDIRKVYTIYRHANDWRNDL